MREISEAAVIGAGTMGLGIAGQLANAGVNVLLLDIPADGPNRNAVAERAIERLLDESQPGLTHPDNLKRIRIGNIEDDLDKIVRADWVAEAVVEQLEVKKRLYKKIDAVRQQGSVVSSNTSSIPISLLVEDMPQAFRAEFAITHFFNPVRYMRLLELVRGVDTRPDVIARLASFNEKQMGKGIVVCKDTPGFLGNRVGVFAIQTALHAAFKFGLKPEDADAIFGRSMGIPKTGVFGLYDLIGIDLMSDVVKSLGSTLPADDAFHQVSAEIPLMTRMISAGLVGNKGTKGGFYRWQDASDVTTKQTLDFASFEYRALDRDKPESAQNAERDGDFTRLLEGDDMHTRYAWEVLSTTLNYAATLVPDVNECLVAIDDAMKLGYNWIQGPFEMIDTLGADRLVARLENDRRAVAPFLRTSTGKSMYRVNAGQLQHLLADGRYSKLEREKGVVRFGEERRKFSPILENQSASYFELEDDIGLIEFHSKANTLDRDSMELIAEATDHATENFGGLIVHNDAQHFSCGVNLAGVHNYIGQSDYHGLDRFLDHFQHSALALKHAPIPVVVAPSGLSLGGGFEIVLNADSVVCHANSVFGLVETLVGLVPGGGGVKEMLYRWSDHHKDTAKGAWDAFINIGYGKTARSPLEANPLQMFRPQTDRFLMNRDRLLATALERVVELQSDYEPFRRGMLKMPGRDTWQEMLAWLDRARSKGHLTPHDVTTGSQVALIVTGGDIDAGTEFSEADLFALERTAFVTLAKTQETRARIEFMLEYGSPLRN